MWKYLALFLFVIREIYFVKIRYVYQQNDTFIIIVSKTAFAETVRKYAGSVALSTQ